MKVQVHSGPCALSLSGGGSKGAYTVGVLKYLREVLAIEDYRILYGTSTGALIAAKLAAAMVTGNTKHLTELEDIYRSVKTGDILKMRKKVAHAVGGEIGGFLNSALDNKSSIYDSKPLQKLLGKYIPDSIWGEIASNSEIEVGFATVNMKGGKAVLFTNRTHPDPKVLKAAMLASASMPIYMPPVTIGDQQYIDGGVVDYNPIEHVFTSPLTGVVNSVISISTAQELIEQRAEPKDIVDITARIVGMLIDGVHLEDLSKAFLFKAVQKLKELLPPDEWQSLVDEMPHYLQERVARITMVGDLPISRFSPQLPIEMDSLEFSQPAMSDLVDRGFKETAAVAELAPTV